MARHRELFATCARLLLIAAVASCTSLDEAQPTVDTPDAARVAAAPAAFAITREGAVRGEVTATTRVFRGIPYAEPPVGALRWRPPRPAARHPGVLDATRFANHCAQDVTPFGVASTTEDCLYLNVFAPREPAARPRPVMVWIHGGALITGESDDYDPTRMVEHGGVVVVTINYRLGELGFLAHPALTAESPAHASGNYGLMDQQAALRWVQRNIASFDGDPYRVTIFGESAGGLSVHSQLVSPGSRGLFQRAIVQSGAYQLTIPTLEAAEAAGASFAAAAGCTDHTAACLRQLSVAQILAAQPSRNDASPTIDHEFLTQSIGKAFARGEFHRVPVLEGANHDEQRLFVALDDLLSGPVTEDSYPAAIQRTLGVPADLGSTIAAEYPLTSFPSPDLAIAALGTDATFNCSARRTAQLLSQFVPMFTYEFHDPDAPQRFLPPVAFPYGAAHASELSYLFDLPVTVPAPSLDADQERLASAMIAAWTTFARTGQPATVPAAGWPRYQPASDTFQDLVPPAPRQQASGSFATDHRCAFWDALTP